jgi:hypothetical protein
MSLPRTPELEAALVQASDQIGLQDYYRDLVRPLLGLPESSWPSCCAGNCEPCSLTLVAVARRVHELLGVRVESE